MRPEKAFIEKKFMSDSMLFELGQKLCDKQLLSRSQLDELNARCALTGDQLDKLILKESVVGEQEVLNALSDSRVSHSSIWVIFPYQRMR